MTGQRLARLTSLPRTICCHALQSLWLAGFVVEIGKGKKRSFNPTHLYTGLETRRRHLKKHIAEIRALIMRIERSGQRRICEETPKRLRDWLEAEEREVEEGSARAIARQASWLNSQGF